MEAPFLVGEQILLRALTQADCAGNYVRWFNDADVCRYNSHHVFPFRSKDARTYIRRIKESKTDLALAVVLKADKRHIGNIALQGIDLVNRSAEFAIVIGEKDCWGKGYSKEASQLLLDHAFSTLNLYRVHCGTSQDNISMQKLARFLGMKKEGCRRRALFRRNCYLDMLEYGVLKPDYLRLARRRGPRCNKKRSAGR